MCWVKTGGDWGLEVIGGFFKEKGGPIGER